MKKSRIASAVPHPESSLRHLPLVDLLVDNQRADVKTAHRVLVDLAKRRAHLSLIRRMG